MGEPFSTSMASLPPGRVGGCEHGQDRSDAAVRALMAQKTRFCLFLYKNCIAHTRLNFFDKLSEYKFVHAPGVCKHNHDDPDLYLQWHHGSHANWRNFEDGRKIFRKYKFVIAFDNAKNALKHMYHIMGWGTGANERLPNTWLAGAVPIVWGTLPLFFNKRAFVYVDNDVYDFTAAIELIKYLDQNDTAYAEMLKEPLILRDRMRMRDTTTGWPLSDPFEMALSDWKAVFLDTYHYSMNEVAPSMHQIISDVVDCKSEDSCQLDRNVEVVIE